MLYLERRTVPDRLLCLSSLSSFRLHIISASSWIELGSFILQHHHILPYLSTMPQLTFKRNAHISFFKRCLTMLPSAVEGYDGNRITMAYFCLSALDLLEALETNYTAEERQEWVRWVWALQKS